MNIKDAKKEISNTVKAYLAKDEFGNLLIPLAKQRPLFLLGAPGIGKTAVIEQVAHEMNIGVISYSMTHHTRQSALGLPMIESRDFGGREYKISEYTMSEIVASVYDAIKRTGKRNGILFLDEINCVSETLSPAMLQFLQYKTFGQHRIPDGWIVITAGNPPEFNNSVKEYDVATLDRIKVINVEPDYLIWKEYAYKHAVHASITSYLDLQKNHFFRIMDTVDGKQFVTARAWSDLSNIINVYERMGMDVNYQLISQYIHDPKIANKFSLYYDLYNKYKDDYQISEIIKGKASKDIVKRAQEAKFDERFCILGLLLDKVRDLAREHYRIEQLIVIYADSIKEMIPAFTDETYSRVVGSKIEDLKKQISLLSSFNNENIDEIKCYQRLLNRLTALASSKGMAKCENKNACYQLLKEDLQKLSNELRENSAIVRSSIDNSFIFCADAFDSNEMAILLAEISLDFYCYDFISKNGSNQYFKYCEKMKFTERKIKLLDESNYC